MSEAHDISQIPHTLAQCDEAPALDSTDEGEATGLQRVVIRFTLFRARPLDPDNAAASCKDLLDGCRHAGLLQGDEWWRIEFTTRQKKVRSYAEEKTLIEIET